ncbi:hypothetical protein BUALT_Bualt17G0003200 [Buddleja alternifolia]|uniref:Glabrous enhancer-binding protein-like DBD domain-containing protein n=1 Tax=Buddleja alternifolia TaxID=168488 RepID=A0AAV6W6M4_9LAMI|nr:hypothetical protein BUALT_Bualt17G0003200 [Buddleja alternifolia]
MAYSNSPPPHNKGLEAEGGSSKNSQLNPHPPPAPAPAPAPAQKEEEEEGPESGSEEEDESEESEAEESEEGPKTHKLNPTPTRKDDDEQSEDEEGSEEEDESEECSKKPEEEGESNNPRPTPHNKGPEPEPDESESEEWSKMNPAEPEAEEDDKASNFIMQPKNNNNEKKKPHVLKTFSEEDEITLLKGLAHFWKDNGRNNKWTEFHLFIKDHLLPHHYTKTQVSEKIRGLKKKFHRAAANATASLRFSDPHDALLFELSNPLWGGGGGEEEDDNRKRVVGVGADEENCGGGGANKKQKLELERSRDQFERLFPLLWASSQSGTWKQNIRVIGMEDAIKLEKKLMELKADELLRAIKTFSLIKNAFDRRFPTQSTGRTFKGITSSSTASHGNQLGNSRSGVGFRVGEPFWTLKRDHVEGLWRAEKQQVDPVSPSESQNSVTGNEIRGGNRKGIMDTQDKGVTVTTDQCASRVELGPGQSTMQPINSERVSQAAVATSISGGEDGFDSGGGDGFDFRRRRWLRFFDEGGSFDFIRRWRLRFQPEVVASISGSSDLKELLKTKIESRYSGCTRVVIVTINQIRSPVAIEVLH